MPPMVLIMTGQTVGSTVTTNSVCSENPNRSNPSGANAIPGIGRSTSMLASKYFRASGENPSKSPAQTPTSIAIVHPMAIDSRV